jgi:hypothetical protein
MIAKATIRHFLTSTFFLLFGACCSTCTLALLTTPSVTVRRSHSNDILTHHHHHQQHHHRHSNKIVPSPLFLSTKDSSFLVPSTTTTTTTAGSPEEERRVARLRQLSNVASVLCVLDCTLLPVLTVVLPLLGSLTVGGGIATASHLEALHQLGHSLAVWFVLPVGTSTTLVNYYLSHRNPWLVGLASVGLGLVALANLHLPSSIVGLSLSWLHQGVWHRGINLLGCAMLLGSNYISQRLGCGCGLPHESNNQNLANGSGTRSSTRTSTSPTTGTRTPMAMQTSLIRWKKANGAKKS